LAAVLRSHAGVASELLDANVGGPLPFESLVEKVLAFNAASKAAGGHPIVGISAVTQVISSAGALADRIKASHPDVLVILGGYHPTFAHREILHDFRAVDLCVRGEGEQTLIEIVQTWRDFWAVSREEPEIGEVDWSRILGVTWRRGEEILTNPSRPNLTNLDAIPFPARDLLPPLDAYASYADTVAGKLRVKASMVSSRGCPFHCNFCSIITFYGDAGGKSWRGRSVENVVAEMIELYDRYGASHFEFQDDNFFVRPERALAIVEMFAQSGRDFSYAFLTRADQIVKGERYFPALRQAGLRYVSVGIESGSDASLARMVKQTSVDVNRRALQILHDNDVAAQVEFIMFEPGSTLADLRANLQFIEEQGLYGYFPPLIFSNLLLLTGTPIREQIEREQGLVGSIHETLPYYFEDPRVAEVFKVLAAFQNRLGDAWYHQAFELLDAIPALEIRTQGRSGDGPLRQHLGLYKLEFFALTRLPYNLLRQALLEAAANHLIPIEALLQKAEAEFATIGRRLREIQQALTLELLESASAHQVDPFGARQV
jgi:radical SAM superfamily enzyme YgiQ (UPF0313 family)